MRNITFQEGKVVSVGTHDDLAMACWICDQAIRAGGFSFDFGEDVETDVTSFDQLMKELTEDEDSDKEPVIEEGKASGNLIDEDDPLVVRNVKLPEPEIGRWL
jgi:hypothetical protein